MNEPLRNRAKCKLCGDILESFHRHDYVTCTCGEIGIDGGMDYFKCNAKDWKNFLRIDNEGNEITPRIVEEAPKEEEKPIELSIDTKIDMLKNMVEIFRTLPDHERYAYLTQQDFYASLSLVLELIESMRGRSES